MSAKKEKITVSDETVIDSSKRFSLAFLRCVYRASFCACAAIDADFRIDGVLFISSRDSLYRTLFDASSAVDAFVANYISHGISSF